MVPSGARVLKGAAVARVAAGAETSRAVFVITVTIAGRVAAAAANVVTAAEATTPLASVGALGWLLRASISNDGLCLKPAFIEPLRIRG